MRKGTDRVVQAVDLQHDGFGPLVGRAKEELGLASARGRGLGLLGLCVAGVLEDLVDLRSQQLGLPRRRASVHKQQLAFSPLTNA